MMKSFKVQMISLIIVCSSILSAAFIANQPMMMTQPDGTTFECLASGDEFFNYLHKDGYTVIQDVEDGYFYYAEKVNNKLVPSNFQVGLVNPASTSLQKNVVLSKSDYLKKRDDYFPVARDDVRAPTTGTLNNIVVFIRFADQTEFPDPRSVFDDRFNADEDGVESMYSYYKEVSYNTLEINSSSYPVSSLDTNVSYQDSHPRGYFMPYNATTNPEGYSGSGQSTTREHQLLADAIASIEAQVPTDLDIDGDNDGNVDNVCFIIRGGNGAWADLLWAHRFYLYSQNVFIHGKRVYDYTFQPVSQNDVTTLNHEMFHALGAPDLYHYDDGGGNPNGPYSRWDIMNGSNSHMSAYMKYYYGGWISDIPEITQSGTYALNPLTSETGNCYKIQSPNNSNEYFVLEYRKKIPGTYENNIPGSGLTISRVNANLAGQGNASGPPDELYLYRRGGTYELDGEVTAANFSAEMGRTEFNDTTNPSCFLSNGNNGGIFIHQIGDADETISFIIDPQLGFLNGQISVDSGEVDFSTANISIDGQNFSPSADGSYQFAHYEGTYDVTVELDSYSSYTGEITILPNETGSMDFNLVYLSAPSNLTFSIDDADLTLNWEYSVQDDFTQFKVYRKVLSYPFSLIGTTTDPTYTLNVNTALSYSFYVVAEYSNGESIPSNEVTFDPTDAQEADIPVLSDKLEQNIPNPFNPSTRIDFALKEEGKVLLEVFNVKGQKVKTLVNGIKSSGNHTTIWNGKDEMGKSVSSGIYYYKMKTKSDLELKKMLLMK